MNEDYDGVENRAINPFQNGFAGQTHALRIRRGLSNYNNHALRVRSMPSIRSSAYAHALRVKKDPPVYNRYTRYSPVGHALRIKKGGFSGFNHALRVRRGGENELYDGYFCKGFGEFISSSEISRIIYNFDQGKK